MMALYEVKPTYLPEVMALQNAKCKEVDWQRKGKSAHGDPATARLQGLWTSLGIKEPYIGSLCLKINRGNPRTAFSLSKSSLFCCRRFLFINYDLQMGFNIFVDIFWRSEAFDCKLGAVLISFTN